MRRKARPKGGAIGEASMAQVAANLSYGFGARMTAKQKRVRARKALPVRVGTMSAIRRNGEIIKKLEPEKS